MAKFLVVYYSSKETMEATKNMSPEEHKEGMAKWMAWAQQCGAGLADFGGPVKGGQSISSAGTIGADRGVIGYSFLEADDMAGAQAMLADHPHLSWGPECEIDVYEVMHMPKMGS